MAKSTLEIIEEARKELVFRIQTLTKLPISDISVDIVLSPENYISTYISEANQLKWHFDNEKMVNDKYAEWYTSDIPQGGSTTFFTNNK